MIHNTQPGLVTKQMNKRKICTAPAMRFISYEVRYVGLLVEQSCKIFETAREVRL
jgi:hypothetical protein